MNLMELLRRAPGEKYATVCHFGGRQASIELAGGAVKGTSRQLQRFEAVILDALHGGGSLLMVAKDGRKGICYWVQLGDGAWKPFHEAPHMSRLKDSRNKYHGDLRAFA